MQIELTEDEYKTVMSALNHYGHTCLEAASSMAQKTWRGPKGEPCAHGDIALAHRCGDKAFSLQRKFHDAAEVA